MQFPAVATPGNSGNKANPALSADDWSGTSVSVFSGPSRVVLVISGIAALLGILLVVSRRLSVARIDSRLATTIRQPQPWHFHFSLRGLAILVALICAYLSGWRVTKMYAVDPSPRHRSQLREGPNGIAGWHTVSLFEDAPLPFVICRRELGEVETRRYFLWLFGAEFRLLEREVNQNTGWEILRNPFRYP